MQCSAPEKRKGGFLHPLSQKPGLGCEAGPFLQSADTTDTTGTRTCWLPPRRGQEPGWRGGPGICTQWSSAPRGQRPAPTPARGLAGKGTPSFSAQEWRPDGPPWHNGVLQPLRGHALLLSLPPSTGQTDGHRPRQCLKPTRAFNIPSHPVTLKSLPPPWGWGDRSRQRGSRRMGVTEAWVEPG